MHSLEIHSLEHFWHCTAAAVDHDDGDDDGDGDVSGGANDDHADDDGGDGSTDDNDDDGGDGSTDDNDDDGGDGSADDNDDDGGDGSADDNDDDGSDGSADDNDDDGGDGSTDDNDDDGGDGSTDDNDDDGGDGSTDDNDDDGGDGSTDDNDDNDFPFVMLYRKEITGKNYESLHNSGTREKVVCWGGMGGKGGESRGGDKRKRPSMKLNGLVIPTRGLTYTPSLWTITMRFSETHGTCHLEGGSVGGSGTAIFFSPSTREDRQRSCQHSMSGKHQSLCATHAAPNQPPLYGKRHNFQLYSNSMSDM